MDLTSSIPVGSRLTSISLEHLPGAQTLEILDAVDLLVESFTPVCHVDAINEREEEGDESEDVKINRTRESNRRGEINQGTHAAIRTFGALPISGSGVFGVSIPKYDSKWITRCDLLTFKVPVLLVPLCSLSSTRTAFRRLDPPRHLQHQA